MHTNTRFTSSNDRAPRQWVRVVAAGTFDWVHPGHVHFLSAAKALGDHLTVIVARDATVRRIKGTFPITPEEGRKAVISAVRGVDAAVLGNEGDIFQKIVELNPDILAMGYDQQPEDEALRKALAERGLSCQVVRISSWHPESNKTSVLKRRLGIETNRLTT
ncbi:MAG: adenylyltransferase/cytidyltransferase family protein [Candidatus Diapherotrites archaeon]|nr:adenylyltransferase/cytidyltransferase family protein [Candidatus Diapherotrites archaeon]MDZ4256295.1 adenylyltransferase/cytidyltransferase family protein [archaeon]